MKVPTGGLTIAKVLFFCTLVHVLPSRGVQADGQPPPKPSYNEPSEEISMHQEEFKALDKNSDGKLSAVEIMHAAREEGIEEEDVTAFIEELDGQRSDSHVDWEEYMHALINQEFDNEIPEEFDGNMDDFVRAANEVSEAAQEEWQRKKHKRRKP